MHISIPKHASDIIKTLSSHGYEAFVVGGCVRDSILGKEPADWDITTSALPEQVKALFPRTIDTGLKHGTVTIMMDKIGYEVTTYRIDGTYEDHRRPNDVTFTSSLREDLMRRDFTINAMAYNEEKGLVDLFGGIQDLNDRIIRCVGNPTERFDEDALRMFRAVRFAGQLNFNIEKGTLAAIEAQHAFLKDVSAERIQIELLKLLISGHPEMIRAAYETGLTSVFLPEFDRMMGLLQIRFSALRCCFMISQNQRPALRMRMESIIFIITMKPVPYLVRRFFAVLSLIIRPPRWSQHLSRIMISVLMML